MKSVSVDLARDNINNDRWYSEILHTGTYTHFERECTLEYIHNGLSLLGTFKCVKAKGNCNIFKVCVMFKG